MIRRLALCVLLVMTACNGAARSSSVTNATSPAAGRKPTAVAGVNRAIGSEGLATPTVRAQSRQATGSKAASRPVIASLSLPCARSGVDLQALTISGLKKGDVAGFSTQYSDGSNEVTTKSYKSGFGMGKAGAGGEFRAVWRIPPNAPGGNATVLVIYSSGSAPLKPSFVVKSATGTC